MYKGQHGLQVSSIRYLHTNLGASCQKTLPNFSVNLNRSLQLLSSHPAFASDLTSHCFKPITGTCFF